MNPLLQPSPLPMGAPPFDRIRDEHFAPAFEAGMDAEREEVAAIIANPEPPTFANTLVALERSGQLLERVSLVFNGLAAANTNERLQTLQQEMAPRLAAHDDTVLLDQRLFARVEAVFDTRLHLGLDPESLRLVEEYYQRFVRAGARVPESDKVRLRALNEEEASLCAQYVVRLLDASRQSALVVTDEADLDGLSPDDRAAAAAGAAARDLAGAWVLPLHNTTQQPLLASLARRTTRERLFRASLLRAERGDEHDTRTIVSRLAVIRAEKAALLGYPTYAAWVLEDQMARTPDAVEVFLDRLIGPARAKAAQEARAIQARMAAVGENGVELEAWDWDYFAEQVRQADYDLDTADLLPYFELGRVLRDGVFFAATALYGISFHERHDLPVYHPDVRVFDVLDHDGTPLALFYLDVFARDNKNGGAWMDNFVLQSRLLGTRPVVYNVCNIPRPAPGQPVLLSLDDVRTFFHEFGHALHGLFADQVYPSLSGTNVPRDFVELPSQFNEHWAFHPEVLPKYAVHHRTGEPLPDAVASRIREAVTFNQGYSLTEILAAAVLDMRWHTLAPGTPAPDPVAFEAEALRARSLDVRAIPPRYRSSHFLHIWANGYAAGYYAYLWAEMLDNDAYAWFLEHGGLTRANGDRFRQDILSRGNAGDFAGLYRHFRGADPDIAPMLVHRGLLPSSEPAGR